ncbi:MAG: IS110 family transposase [Halomonadaceae bacterium]|nr:IS110 family transposase [Halomonadaceae bacterium]
MTYGVGIDVSQAWLDVHVHAVNQTTRLPNTPQGFSRLAKWLSTREPGPIVLEATGGYEQAALDALHDAGFAVIRVNPRQARDFAKACGQLSKTDRLDARVLAHMAQVLPLPLYQPPEPWQRRLAQYQQRRAQLQLTLQQERQRTAHLTDDWLCEQAQEALRHWQAMLKEVDARIAELVASQPQAEVLRDIKGVGPVLLATLLGQLPELGRLNGKAIAKLVGVAPLARDSGTMRGQRRVWGGRASIRATLYMSTLTAIRYEPRLKEFYQSLRQRGKQAKVAIVAAMRKLLVILNAKMRDHLKQQQMAG